MTIKDTKNYKYKKIKNAFLISIFLILIFMIIEFVVGIISGSLALISDASHMMSDLISLILALIGIWISQRKSTPDKSYGYSRIEIITSFANTLFLIFICGLIAFEAFHRIINPLQVDSLLMIPVAIAGLIINLVVMFILRNTNFSHGTGYFHHEHSTKQVSSLLVSSAYLHVFTDMLGSIIAIISGIIIYFTDYYIVDPILSLLLVFMIIKNTFKIITKSVNILIESSPKEINPEDIKDCLEKYIPDIISVHHIHVWMLNEEENLLTLHLEVVDNADFSKILKQSKEYIKEYFGITHATIQIELSSYRED